MVCVCACVKINGKVVKPNTDNGLKLIFRLYFIERLLQKGGYFVAYMLWGHILLYPKDGPVQLKHILRASSLGKDNFSFLTRHLTERLQAENGLYFFCMTSFFLLIQ